MKVYKATDKNMVCNPSGDNPFQFEIGKTYEKPKAELCKHGFHACEAPLDVFSYYAPGDGSRYFEADLEDVSDQRRNDSKVCGKKITIGAEIGIPGLVKAHIEYVKTKCEKENSATGSWSANSATGDGSANSATGSWSANSATGYGSANSATGYWSANSATGSRSANSATGYGSANITTGLESTNSGGMATINVGWGKDNKCKCEIGAYIVCSEWGEWDGKKYPLIAAKMGIVDGEMLKPDTWYTLKDGEFVEVDE